ncbi:MAG: hypothetical protein ACFFCZ_24780 [Promethearchaeota archaeon]
MSESKNPNASQENNLALLKFVISRLLLFCVIILFPLSLVLVVGFLPYVIFNFLLQNPIIEGIIRSQLFQYTFISLIFFAFIFLPVLCFIYLIIRYLRPNLDRKIAFLSSIVLAIVCVTLYPTFQSIFDYIVAQWSHFITPFVPSLPPDFGIYFLLFLFIGLPLIILLIGFTWNLVVQIKIKRSGYYLTPLSSDSLPLSVLGSFLLPSEQIEWSYGYIINVTQPWLSFYQSRYFSALKQDENLKVITHDFTYQPYDFLFAITNQRIILHSVLNLIHDYSGIMDGLIEVHSKTICISFQGIKYIEVNRNIQYSPWRLTYTLTIFPIRNNVDDSTTDEAEYESNNIYEPKFVILNLSSSEYENFIRTLCKYLSLTKAQNFFYRLQGGWRYDLMSSSLHFQS